MAGLQDVLNANTFVFKDSLSVYRLPSPQLEVRKAAQAKYDLWPIRFELDEKGRIWEVISKSIYVGRLDFVRELLQNAIDATLAWIYMNDKAIIDGQMPRLWRLPGYEPTVVVLLDPGSIEVIDNGVGMDRDGMQKFLFKVAETGFVQELPNRKAKFPSIAKFGVGFVSCLVRARSIVINTRLRAKGGVPIAEGRRVILKTQALDALSESQQCSEGTGIWVELKDRTSSSEIAEYVRSTFMYPSVPILVVDVAQMNSLCKFAETIGVDVERSALLGWRSAKPSLVEAAVDANKRYDRLRKAVREKTRHDDGVRNELATYDRAFVYAL